MFLRGFKPADFDADVTLTSVEFEVGDVLMTHPLGLFQEVPLGSISMGSIRDRSW